MTHPTLELKSTYLALRKVVEGAVAEFGMTAAQFDVFQQLLHEDGLRHHDLRDRLAVESPTLTTVLDGMVRKGFIERRSDSVDARVRRIYLSAAGHALCHSPAFAAAGHAVVARMFRGLSPAERDTFLAALRQVRANLTDRA